MQKRFLGKTDLEFSLLGLGTWALGGGNWAYGWGPQDEQDSVQTIIEALELGINWIDTAPVYGMGVAETVVGKALKQWPDKVCLATKCGLLGSGKGSLKHQSIIAECEHSLRRLGVEAIDLYQIHWPMPAQDIEEGFLALLHLKEQGKIRWAGVSNFSAAQLSAIANHGEVSSLQPPYSLLRRQVEQDELAWCSKHKCGVISYSPMQCGILAGKLSEQWVASLPSNDWRKTKLEYLKPENLPHLLILVARLKAIAAKTAHTPAQLAVAWVLRRQEITAAIVGARRPGQIGEIIPAAEWKLSNDELEEIDRACAEYTAATSA